ncbi:hypothetical protein [Neobacillus notoginsengisoli]|uniref:hypothetical protein n=1 Tax=Neobacillus notoginsengisoli TaxID=1578198 RepID=UPI001314859F|nr:hypothetical protein [Neobacillus notoginsengisoli]
MRLGGLIGKRPLQILIATVIFLGGFALFSTQINYTYDTFFIISKKYAVPGRLCPHF